MRVYASSVLFCRATVWCCNNYYLLHCLNFPTCSQQTAPGQPGNLACSSFKAFTVDTVDWKGNGSSACAAAAPDTGTHLFYFKVDRYFTNYNSTWHTWLKTGYVSPLYTCNSTRSSRTARGMGNNQCVPCPPGSGACARKTYADPYCFGFCDAAGVDI